MRKLFTLRPGGVSRCSAFLLAQAIGVLALLFIFGAPADSLPQNATAPQAATAPQKSQTPPDQPGSIPAGATFVGSDTCQGCHQEIYDKHFVGTPHYALLKQQGKHGCEDCHGAGSAHVEAGGDATKIIRFKALNEQDQSKLCLNCHAGSTEHANFLRSQHATNDVGCNSCHSAHYAKEQRSLLRQSEQNLCYGCHTETRAEFNRPFRHRVNEGFMQCSDCHNVHGTFQTRQLRTTAAQDQVCMNCHTDTRGPFVFEHLPVKTEGCVSCHMPHGSPNQRLLRVSQVNTLCLQCHTLTFTSPTGKTVPSQPPAGPPHNQAAKYQACTLCHTYIHGSNFSEVYFKP